MQSLKIKLKEIHPLSEDATLDCFIIDNYEGFSKERKRPGLLIIPGGGYHSVCDREGEPVGLKFLGHDISVFVLKYKTKDLKYPAQIIQALVALNVIRKNAKKWNLDENAIYTMGFSAGGHLCATLGTAYKEEEVLKLLGYTYDDVKVNGMILCYPVLTLKEFTHEGSKLNLIGDDQELSEHLSIENRVNSKTPRTFIWYTYNDDVVPMENALIMANALRVNKIPFELHIYEEGPHGLSVSDETSAHDGDDYYINKDVSSWVNLCANWIKRGNKK